MELLLLVFFSLLTGSEVTFGDENEPSVIKVIVEEGSDAILPCSLSTKEDIRFKLFDWKKDGQKNVFLYDAGIHYNNGHVGQDEQFKGRVSHFPEELKSGNASIIIRDTKVADSGDYTCVFPHLQPRQIFHIKLVVGGILKDRTAENITGAAPKPSVTSLKETKDWARLQCEAHGAPKPKLHWQDSDGNVLHAEEPQVSERGGRFYVTLQITVNKTDLFRCVATQEEIGHQIYAETHEYINGAAQEPYVTSLKQTNDWTLLQCKVRGAFPKPKLHWQDSDGKILPAEEPQVTERGGSYDIILQTTVTKTDNYTCVSTQEEIHHQTSAKIHVLIHVSGSSTGLVVGSVLCGLFVLGIIVQIFLVKKGYITLNSKKDRDDVI